MSSRISTADIQFSVDLIRQARFQIRFLKAIDNNHFLKNRNVLKRAIHRYEKYWLPLAAEHPHEYLSAPVDIEWVWHCHMLSPRHYESDCYKIIGRTVNHTILSPDQFTSARNVAHAYWTQKYPVPFYDDLNASANAEYVENYQSVISYDIIAAAERQSVFYYQVSLPHYQDSRFFEQALLRYKQFLLLKRKYPQDFLVPCYDIDIIWHTHQLNPIQYKQDTTRITGQLFNHNDSVNERHEGSRLNLADKRTRELWKETFGESFARCGAMYRGKPSNGKLYTLTQKDVSMCCTQQCVLSLDEIDLKVQTPDLSGNKTLTLKVATSSATSKLKRPSGSTNMAWTNVGSFAVNTAIERGIAFSLKQSKGFMKSKSEIGSKILDLIPLIISTGPGGKSFSEKIQIAENALVSINGNINPPRIGEAVFRLCLGESTVSRQLPNAVHSLLGPISHETLPTTATNHTCLETTHTIKNHLGFETFKVRMFHSTSLMTSVIHVLFQDKLAAIAHVIAADQIPLPTQVQGGQFYLNPKQGERAVLIKNNDGDWGVLVGSWQGLVRGVPLGLKNEKRRIGKPGTLCYRFYKMSTSRIDHVELGYNLLPWRNPFVLNSESFSVDLEGGTFKVNPKSNELAENIAYIFSVALLHVLCVPRYKDWKPGSSFAFNRGNIPSRPVPSERLKVIIAAGLNLETPSNHYIYNHYGAQHCGTCGGVEGYLPIDADWRRIKDAEFGDPGFRDAYGDPNGCGCGGCVGDPPATSGSSACASARCAACSACASCGGCQG